MKEDWQISNIKIVTVKGQRVKQFYAKQKINGIFQNNTLMIAPVFSSDSGLWEIAENRVKGENS